MSGVVLVFGRRHDEAIHALRRPASEKRQGKTRVAHTASFNHPLQYGTGVRSGFLTARGEAYKSKTSG
jgi:hypothetical protein